MSKIFRVALLVLAVSSVAACRPMPIAMGSGSDDGYCAVVLEGTDAGPAQFDNYAEGVYRLEYTGSENGAVWMIQKTAPTDDWEIVGYSATEDGRIWNHISCDPFMKTPADKTPQGGN